MVLQSREFKLGSFKFTHRKNKNDLPWWRRLNPLPNILMRTIEYNTDESREIFDRNKESNDGNFPEDQLVSLRHQIFNDYKRNELTDWIRDNPKVTTLGGKRKTMRRIRRRRKTNRRMRTVSKARY